MESPSSQSSTFHQSRSLFSSRSSALSNSTAVMDSSPRRWVLKPLSPLLQPSDLRSIAGPAPSGPTLCPQHEEPDFGSSRMFEGQSAVVSGSLDVLVQAHQVAVFQDGGSTSDEWSPSSSSNPSSPSSSTGSHCGFYSFVEDPSSPEAELNEAWMVSTQRQAQLATLKEQSGFKLQTYSSNRRPDSLFSNSNGDSRYLVDPTNGLEVVGVEEEKQLRQEIIRTQAPKKNLMSRDQQSLILDLDEGHPSNRHSERFSSSYSPVSVTPQPPQPAEPSAIDKEQINFNAVRQQFLKMEQDQPNALLSPLKTSKTSRTSSIQPDGSSKCNKRWDTEMETPDMEPLHEDETDRQTKLMTFSTAESLSLDSSVVFDELNSGMEELSVHAAGGQTSSKEDRSLFFSSSETPIQREIRLVQEREENLRRSRGLELSSSQPEMVAIKTQRLQSPLTPNRSRDRNRVSFIFQKEVQRQHKEEPQQKLGQYRSDSPLQLQRNQSEPRSTEGGLQDGHVSLSPCCPHRHTEEATFDQRTPTFTHTHSGDSKGSGEDKTSSLIFTSPQVWREKLKSRDLQSRDLASSGQGTPNFIEKEIEETVRREQELRDSRKEILSPAPLVDQATKMVSLLFQPPVNTDRPVSSSSSRSPVRLSSVSFITAQPWTSSTAAPPAPPAPFRSSSFLVEKSTPPAQRGLTETLMLDFEERRGKLRAEESSYAGIQLVDNINNEVIESTRVIRHKNRGALRWEAGQFANQQTQ